MFIKKATTLYGFGSAGIDFRIKVADLGPSYRDKLLAKETSILGGGSVANCLVQTARLGANAFWLGKLGNDWIGKEIIEKFEQDNVGTSHIIIDPTLCSPFNVAVYTEVEYKRIGGFLIPNSLATLTEEDIMLLSSGVGEDDWVIVEVGEIPLNATMKFCREIKRKHANLVIDVDLDPIKQCLGTLEEMQQIFRASDILVPNYHSLKTLYPSILGASDLAEIMACEYGAPTVITVGKQGVFYCQPGGQPLHHKALEVNVIDTVGAGDAFHGGLLYGLASGSSLAKAIELGSRCASLNCMSVGAREGMPTKEELAFEEI